MIDPKETQFEKGTKVERAKQLARVCFVVVDQHLNELGRAFA